MTYTSLLKTAQHLVLFSIALGGLWLISPPTADASRVLYVVPQRAVIEPDMRSTTMTVMNRSEKRRAYEITVIDSVMQADGRTIRVDTFPYSAKRMVRYVPRRVELSPGERQTIRIMVRRPSGLEDGDYHSHILFRESSLQQDETPEEGDASFEVAAQYGVAVPIVVQQGNIESSLRISEINEQLAKEQNTLSVTFQRTGNAEARHHVRAFIKNADGLEEIAQPFFAVAYREVDEVTRQVPLRQGVKLEGQIEIHMYDSGAEDATLLQKFEVNL